MREIQSLTAHIYADTHTRHKRSLLMPIECAVPMVVGTLLFCVVSSKLDTQYKSVIQAARRGQRAEPKLADNQHCALMREHTHILLSQSVPVMVMYQIAADGRTREHITDHPLPCARCSVVRAGDGSLLSTYFSKPLGLVECCFCMALLVPTKQPEA